MELDDEGNEKNKTKREKVVWGFLSFYPIDFTSIMMKLWAQLEQFRSISSLDWLLVLLLMYFRWFSSTFLDTFQLKKFHFRTLNNNWADNNFVIIIWHFILFLHHFNSNNKIMILFICKMSKNIFTISHKG